MIDQDEQGPVPRDRDIEADDRHLIQAENAHKVNSFIESLEAYKPAIVAAGIIILIMLATMAYGIVNTNHRATENQKLYRDTVACVAELVDDNPEDIELRRCEPFAEELDLR